MKKVDATRAREAFSDTLNEVAFGHDRIVLSRHGKDIAALVPIRDLDLIERCEEQEKEQEAQEKQAGPRRRPRRSPKKTP